MQRLLLLIELRRDNLKVVSDEQGILNSARDQLTLLVGRPMATGRDNGVYAGVISVSQVMLNVQKLVDQGQNHDADSVFHSAPKNTR